MNPSPLKLASVASVCLLSVAALTQTSNSILPKTSSIRVASSDLSQNNHLQRNRPQKLNQIHSKRASIHTQKAALNQRTASRQSTTPSKSRNIRPTRYSYRRQALQPSDTYFIKVGHPKTNPMRTTWRQIHQGFQLKNYNHKAKVRRYIRSYRRMPKQMAKLSHRSAKYLPAIIAEVKRRKMPTEVALLPFVESAFNSNAYSPAKAAGLWQFMPATARQYGLKVSARYDARYNAKASTRAALHFLQDLNRRFKGDWLLTLAAYNCGEARVQREIIKNIARGLPTDFWNLRLPKETRHYVPKLLAFKEIYGNPSSHGMQIAHIPSNPAFHRTSSRSITQKGKQYQHKSIVHDTGRKIKKLTKKRLVTHKIRSGDTLYRIARKYRTSVRKIMRINGLKSTRIIAGKRLKVALVTHVNLVEISG